MKISLQQAGIEETEILLEFIERYFNFDHIPFQKPEVLAGLKLLLANPAYGTAWLVRSGSQTLGYAILTYGFDLEYGGHRATLTDLYLEQAFRGRGIGKAALDQISVFAQSKGMLAIELQVENENIPAQKVYEKSGFKRHRRFTMFRRFNKERP